jgi:hypothetical protein
MARSTVGNRDSNVRTEGREDLKNLNQPSDKLSIAESKWTATEISFRAIRKQEVMANDTEQTTREWHSLQHKPQQVSDVARAARSLVSITHHNQLVQDLFGSPGVTSGMP